MDKARIIDEIRRTAKENGGTPLGEGRFRSETGIRESDWYGKYWARWGDAVREAGFSPNAFQSKVLSDEQLLEKLIALIREFGHYPTRGELGIKRRGDSSFPVDDVFFRRFGGRYESVKRLVKHCLAGDGYEDVLAICQPLEMQSREASDPKRPQSLGQVGYVYLLKSGRYYKIGRTNAVGRREYELAIQLPEKMTRIHTIKTDDPAGIEAYWHRRFQDRRKQGEWFALAPQDVSAFRRRNLCNAQQASRTTSYGGVRYESCALAGRSEAWYRA